MAFQHFQCLLFITPFDSIQKFNMFFAVSYTHLKARFYRLIDYGEQHVDDEVKIEYFAVSLPDFLIFEDDLNVRNKAHCYYLMGLGKLGLGDKKEAAACFDKALNYDPNHQNALRYRAETV